MTRATEAQLEALSTALDAYNRADLSDDGSFDAANDCIRAQNRLIDACVDCGMPVDGDEFNWAAQRVAHWLLSAQFA